MATTPSRPDSTPPKLLNSPPPPSCCSAVTAAAASTDTLHQKFASIDHDRPLLQLSQLPPSHALQAGSCAMRDLLFLGPSTPLLSSRRPSETSRLQLLRFVNTSSARVCTNNADMYQLCARIAKSGIYPSLAPKSSTYAPNARIMDIWNTSALSTRTYTQRCNPPKEQPSIQHRCQRDTSLRTKWDSWRTVSRVSKVLSKSLELLM
jgi:hypothetical protein